MQLKKEHLLSTDFLHIQISVAWSIYTKIISACQVQSAFD